MINTVALVLVLAMAAFVAVATFLTIVWLLGHGVPWFLIVTGLGVIGSLSRDTTVKIKAR